MWTSQPPGLRRLQQGSSAQFREQCWATSRLPTFQQPGHLYPRHATPSGMRHLEAVQLDQCGLRRCMEVRPAGLTSQHRVRVHMRHPRPHDVHTLIPASVSSPQHSLGTCICSALLLHASARMSTTARGRQCSSSVTEASHGFRRCELWPVMAGAPGLRLRPYARLLFGLCHRWSPLMQSFIEVWCLRSIQ